MIIQDTPKWTHITRDGRKAVVITDKMCDDDVYTVTALLERAGGYSVKYYTQDLKFNCDGEESKHDLRPYDPLESVPVDAPIWVRDTYGKWQRRHFAYEQNGKVYTWVDGKTSFTETNLVFWNEYSLTDPASEL